MSSESRGETTAGTDDRTALDPAMLASAASVALSWFYFFRGDRQMGLFVGLWPPTILAFAGYVRQSRMSDRLEHVVRKGDLMDRVERMLQSR